MIRTQFYLPEDLTWELKLLAQQLDVSLAEVVRKALIRGIPEIKKKRTKGLGAIIGMIKIDKAPRDLSERIDKYLFGEK
jgi:hypothetical protein